MKHPLPPYAALIGRPYEEGILAPIEQLAGPLIHDTEISEFYMRPDDSVSVPIKEGRIAAINFASPHHPCCAPYRGELPLGLDFDMAQDELEGLLGAPDARRDVASVRRRDLTWRMGPTLELVVHLHMDSGRIESLALHLAETEE